jgi:hypothetical protein
MGIFLAVVDDGVATHSIIWGKDYLVVGSNQYRGKSELPVLHRTVPLTLASSM